MRRGSHGVRNIRANVAFGVGPVSRCMRETAERLGGTETGVTRQDDRLRAIFDAELRENAGDVIANGLGAQAEMRGDLGVVAALRDQLDKIELAWGQRLE